MKYLAIIILIKIAFFLGCENIKSTLAHSKNYQVVDETDLDLLIKNRTAKLYSIVSDAQTVDEIAQTAILPAYELHNKYGYDLTSVLLYHNKNLIRTGTYFAQVEYASDNKGTRGLQGVDKNLFTSGKWKVKSASNLLSTRELEILNLWYSNQHKFPNKNAYSSSSYEKSELKNYIAEELKIDVKEVKLPKIVYEDYKNLTLKNWMTPVPK